MTLITRFWLILEDLFVFILSFKKEITTKLFYWSFEATSTIRMRFQINTVFTSLWFRPSTRQRSVFTSLWFRPSTRQRSVFESLRFRWKRRLSKTMNKRLRVDGRRRRTEKSPFSHENVSCGRGAFLFPDSTRPVIMFPPFSKDK